MRTAIVGGLALVAALGIFALWSGAHARREPGRDALPGVEREPAELEDAPSALSPVETPAERSVLVLEATSDVARELATDGPSVAVRVVDPRRTPLAGVRVRLLAHPLGELLGEGESAADGLVELPFDGDAPLVHWEAEHEGYLRTSRLASAMRISQLVLRPAATLRGHVVAYGSRAPVAGAVIEHAPLGCEVCTPARAVSDAAGNFTLPIASGSLEELLRFTLRAPGYRTSELAFVAREPGALVERDFVLVRREHEVHGRVVDLVTGAGLANARVTLGSDVLAVDARGGFSSLVLEPGRAEARWQWNQLVATAPGHCQVVVDADAAESPLAVPLPIHARLVGRVSDPEDRSLAANVRLHGGTLRALEGLVLPAGWQAAACSGGVSTDDEGRYALECVLPRCTAQTLYVEAAGFEPRAFSELPAIEPGSQLAFNVTLTPAGMASVEGALTVNGRPKEGLVLWKRDEMRMGKVIAQGGRYRIPAVPAGEVELRALPGEREIETFVPEARVTVTLDEGQALTHDFVFQLASANMSGNARYEDGTPAPGLELRVQLEGNGWVKIVRTDERGRFSLGVPAPGSYELTLRDGGFQETRKGLAPDAEVDFTLPAMGRLRFRSREHESGEIVHASWSWRRAGVGEYEPLRVDMADAQGFREARLPVGRVDLFADGAPAGFRSAIALDLAVRAQAEPEQVTLELERGETLALVFERPGELPPSALLALPRVEDWDVLACLCDGREPFRLSLGGRLDACLEPLRVDRTGRVLLRGLAPGRYRFKAFHEALTFDPEVTEVRPFEVDGVEAQTIQVRWSLGSR
jgi:carboxypeptidase family protein